MTSLTPETSAAPTAPPVLPGERWGRVALVFGARVWLAFLLGCLVWTTTPALLGWHSTVVSSGSMSPRLPVGSVLVSAPTEPSAVRLGNVVLTREIGNRSRLLSHRYVGRDPAGNFLTRGDANSHDDSAATPPADVIGVGRLLVPYAGLPTLWLHTGQVLPLAGWLVVTALAAALVRWDRAQRRRASGRIGRRWRPGARPAAVAVLAVIAVAAPSTGSVRTPALSLAAFSATTSNSADSWVLDPSAQFGPGNYAAAVLADTPLLFWKLAQNPATGVALDSSASGTQTGTYNATGVTGGQAGPFARETSSSVLFDGASGCVRGTTTANLVALSVEAWFKTTTTRGGKIVGYGNSNTTANSGTYDRHIYMTNAGTLYWGVYPNSVQTVSTTAAYNDGQWHHVVGTVGVGSAMSIYVDGVLKGSQANTGVQNYVGYLHVGCDNLAAWTNVPTSFFFAGNIADVAVYPTVLTAAKVASHYYAG